MIRGAGLRNMKLIPLLFLFIIVGLTYYGLTRRTIKGLSSKKHIHVVTSLPVTHSLVTVLAQNTKIRPLFVPAGKLEDQANYLKENEHLLAEQFAQADATVTIRGVWREDPLYLYVRRANLQALEIDASGTLNISQPIGLLGDPTVPGRDAIHLWQSLAVVGEMADVVADDLQRLVRPRQRRNIGQNLLHLKRELTTSRELMATRLAKLKHTRIAALGPDFVYLAEDLNLYVAGYFARPESTWQYEEYQKLTELIRGQEVKLIIGRDDPSDKLLRTIESAGASWLKLDPIETVNGDDFTLFFKAVAKNQATVVEALEKAQ